MGESSEVADESLLKEFFAEVTEVERDNEVARVLSSFKLNPFEHLNLPFNSSIEEVRRQYRKVSLLIHPDKCKHPRAQEAFAALAKAQTMLLDPEERKYIVSQVNLAKDELRAEKKKALKRDNASKIRALVSEDGVSALEAWEGTPEFKEAWKKRTREILTNAEWRRRKMAKRISEEEGRLAKEEEETRESFKRKREDAQKWEDTRENRVSSWRDFMKTGKKTGAVKPPKLKTEDSVKSYIQRPVKKK